VVRFDVTTLWHLDAAEWAPSTASFASDMIVRIQRGMSASPPIATELTLCRETTRCAKTGLMHRSKNRRLFDHLVGELLKM
jgi:hypothetical protein